MGTVSEVKVENQLVLRKGQHYEEILDNGIRFRYRADSEIHGTFLKKEFGWTYFLLGNSLFRAVLTLLILALPFTANATQKPLPENLAVKAIIGEAENQGFNGMLAVACALRNRGTFKGVYGIASPRVRQPQEWVLKQALKAWKQSQFKDITHGATLWENVKAFGKPNWDFSKLVKVYEYKDHVFYREIK